MKKPTPKTYISNLYKLSNFLLKQGLDQLYLDTMDLANRIQKTHIDTCPRCSAVLSGEDEIIFAENIGHCATCDDRNLDGKEVIFDE